MIPKILVLSFSLFLFSDNTSEAFSPGQKSETVTNSFSEASFSKGKKKKNGRYKKKKRGLFKRLFKKSDCDCPKH